MNKNKYEWGVLISGSKNHPIEVYSGSFVYMSGKEKEFRSLGAGGLYSGYFGSNGSTTNRASKFPLPTELSVIWFSFTEAKFYGGNFELPYDKIVALFKDDSQIRKSDGIGLSLRVGFAPGGLVVVWASCGPYLAYVAHFQGMEMEITLEEFCPEVADEMTLTEYAAFMYDNKPHIIDYLSTHTLESEAALFRRYLERFKTGFRVSFGSPEVNKISNFNAQFANGERLPFFPEDKVFSERGDYASMKYFEVNWYHTDSYGRKSKLQANVCIKKEEFLRIYQEAWGDDHTKAIDVMVNISADNKDIEIYLTDGVNRYDFDKEFIQFAGYNYTSEKLLFRSSNYDGTKDQKFTWDDYSD